MFNTLLYTEPYPALRFAGWLDRKTPTIIGPEKNPDLNPEHPVGMPTIEYVPREEGDRFIKRAKAERLPTRIRLGEPGEMPLELPDIHAPMELDAHPLPEIRLPLPADLNIHAGDKMTVTFPGHDREVAYRLNVLA